MADAHHAAGVEHHHQDDKHPCKDVGDAVDAADDRDPLEHQIRHREHDERADDGAVDGTQAADHHHRQNVQRQGENPHGGVGELDEVHIQRAAQRRVSGGDGEHDEAVLQQVNAHGLGGHFAAAHGVQGAAHLPVDQIVRQHHHQHQRRRQQHKGGLPAQLEAEQSGIARRQAGEAAGELVQLLKGFPQNLGDAQRGDGQIDARHPQGDEAHQHADNGGGQNGDQHRQQEGQAHRAAEVAGNIGPQAHKARRAQGDQPRVAQQQVQAQGHDGVDQHAAQVHQEGAGHDAALGQQGEQGDDHAKQDVPDVGIAECPGRRIAVGERCLALYGYLVHSIPLLTPS